MRHGDKRLVIFVQIQQELSFVLYTHARRKNKWGIIVSEICNYMLKQTGPNIRNSKYRIFFTH